MFDSLGEQGVVPVGVPLHGYRWPGCVLLWGLSGAARFTFRRLVRPSGLLLLLPAPTLLGDRRKCLLRGASFPISLISVSGGTSSGSAC